MRDGLNQDEVKELIEYIQKNNSWENLTDCIKRKRKIPKYYKLFYDTRFGDAWAIEFYQVTGLDHKEVVFIRTEQGKNLKEEIYKWLDEPVEKENK